MMDLMKSVARSTEVGLAFDGVCLFWFSSVNYSYWSFVFYALEFSS